MKKIIILSVLCLFYGNSFSQSSEIKPDEPIRIKVSGTTAGVFGTSSTGISLQQNWPTIGFNQYRDTSNIQRYIGTGYAFGNFINPISGDMAWSSITTGTADSPTSGETQVMYLSKYGDLKINSLGAINPAYPLNIGGNALSAASTGGVFSVGHSVSLGNFFTNYTMKMDGNTIQATSGSILSSGASRLYLNPYGGAVGINTGSTNLTSNLEVYKSASGVNNTAVFKGTTHYSHFHFSSAEDTYIRGGKDGSKVIINDGTLGNVGIGTTNPQYKLSVNGTTQSKEVIVETGWADYVFDENYKLRSIDEMEAFVKENKHLPNIPKASEIETNGLKIGETNKAMMEKIEELALYIIQLKKEIDVLKAKID